MRCTWTLFPIFKGRECPHPRFLIQPIEGPVTGLRSFVTMPPSALVKKVVHGKWHWCCLEIQRALRVLPLNCLVGTLYLFIIYIHTIWAILVKSRSITQKRLGWLLVFGVDILSWLMMTCVLERMAEVGWSLQVQWSCYFSIQNCFDMEGKTSPDFSEQNT